MDYVFRDRSEATCRRLWEKIPEDYRLALCYSGCWQSYQSVVPEEQHTAVGKASGETNHGERWDHTLRQSEGGALRQKDALLLQMRSMHEICPRLFLHRYNPNRLYAPPTRYN